MPAGRALEIGAAERAQPYRADFSLVTHRDHRRQLVVDVDDLVALGRQPRRDVELAQVDDRKLLQPEAAQVVLHARAQLLGPLGRLDRRLDALSRVGPDLVETTIARPPARTCRMTSLAKPSP